MRKNQLVVLAAILPTGGIAPADMTEGWRRSAEQIAACAQEAGRGRAQPRTDYP